MIFAHRAMTALALCMAALSAPAAAQDATQQMLAMAKQVRAQAEQLKSQLSPEDYKAMLDSADEIEKGANAGGFVAPQPATPASQSVTTKVSKAHHGRLEWLMAEEACAGYQWENWRSWSMTVGTNLAARNRACKAAFAEFEQYFRLGRNGQTPEVEQHLAAYEKLAHEAVTLFGKWTHPPLD